MRKKVALGLIAAILGTVFVLPNLLSTSLGINSPSFGPFQIPNPFSYGNGTQASDTVTKLSLYSGPIDHSSGHSDVCKGSAAYMLLSTSSPVSSIQLTGGSDKSYNLNAQGFLCQTGSNGSTGNSIWRFSGDGTVILGRVVSYTIAFQDGTTTSGSAVAQ
jgi:hypothetical protein